MIGDMLLLAWLGVVPGPGLDDDAVAKNVAPLTVESRIELDGPAAPGSKGRLVVRCAVAEGWSVSRAGVPEPILQIQEPASARLMGPRPESREALARNEFLRTPHELLVEKGEVAVDFELTAVPAADERFEFNVLAYVTDGEDSRFVRLRRQVPVRDGAVAVAGDSNRSNWGTASLLNLGDLAEPFDLPSADGDPVVLDDHLGESYILVTTYRAFW